MNRSRAAQKSQIGGRKRVRDPTRVQEKLVCSVGDRPKLKKRTAILAKLREIFRRNESQPVGKVIELINPILRGWVNYFAVGHSSRSFVFIQNWVEKKIRRHIMRAKKRKGFGWKRWSREWLYQVLGPFNDYRKRYYALIPKVAPAR